MSARGFTLVEVIVATVLVGIIALVAHGIFASVVEADRVLTRAVGAVRGPAEARSGLRDACRTLDVGLPGSRAFRGRPRQVEFGAVVIGARGWTAREGIRVAFARGLLVARIGPSDLTLADSVEMAVFDYMGDDSEEGGWVEQWSSSVSAPLAFRIRWIRAGIADSLICPLGGRR